MADAKPGLTHFDGDGQAHMVDVGAKASTAREARASGAIHVLPATLEVIRTGSAGKGDVLGIARVAAIMAAKRTADLIPLCHAIPISSIRVDFALAPQRVVCTVVVATVAPTGVEMEALTAVAIAALTIYDMCKAIDKSMVIDGIRLVKKTGGTKNAIV